MKSFLIYLLVFSLGATTGYAVAIKAIRIDIDLSSWEVK